MPPYIYGGPQVPVSRKPESQFKCFSLWLSDPTFTPNRRSTMGGSALMSIDTVELHSNRASSSAVRSYYLCILRLDNNLCFLSIHGRDTDRVTRRYVQQLSGEQKLQSAASVNSCVALQLIAQITIRRHWEYASLRMNKWAEYIKHS